MNAMTSTDERIKEILEEHRMVEEKLLGGLYLTPPLNIGLDFAV